MENKVVTSGGDAEIEVPEEPYAAWTGYSRRNKNVYDNHHLMGTPIQTLKTNTQVEVLEEYGDCCVVKIEDIIGYMKLEDVSKTRVSSGGGGGSYGGGSSGGGGGQDALQKTNLTAYHLEYAREMANQSRSNHLFSEISQEYQSIQSSM